VAHHVGGPGEIDGGAGGKQTQDAVLLDVGPGQKLGAID
jgi:hypothetical protein